MKLRLLRPAGERCPRCRHGQVFAHHPSERPNCLACGHEPWGHETLPYIRGNNPLHDVRTETRARREYEAMMTRRES